MLHCPFFFQVFESSGSLPLLHHNSLLQTKWRLPCPPSFMTSSRNGSTQRQGSSPSISQQLLRRVNSHLCGNGCLPYFRSGSILCQKVVSPSQNNCSEKGTLSHLWVERKWRCRCPPSWWIGISMSVFIPRSQKVVPPSHNNCSTVEQSPMWPTKWSWQCPHTYTVKKVGDFPVPHRDVNNQTLPGRESLESLVSDTPDSQPGRVWLVTSRLGRENR